MSPDEIIAELTPRLSRKALLRPNEPLARRTTLRVGGCADVYAEPASEADLAQVLDFCRTRGVPLTVLGRGSNLLVRDGGVRGVVVCLAQTVFSTVEVRGSHLHCGAGAKLKEVARQARLGGLSGLEFVEGIPGSVGGALRMNAGAMGSAMFEVLEKVRFMDRCGGVEERAAAEVPVQYRACPLFQTHIALSAVLRGKPDAPEKVAQRMDAYSHKRWGSQPKEPSAGCTFKNPPEKPAGKLIDELGLKGARVGGAAVSAMHGNFIINEGSATARNVLDLIAEIQQRVKVATGIELHPEVEIIGED